MKHLYLYLLFIILISPNILKSTEIDDNFTNLKILMNMKDKAMIDKCKSNIVLPKTKESYLSGEKETLSLHFKPPQINCNGEIEFDAGQFDDMAKQVEAFTKNILNNVELFAKAEARNTLMASSVSLLALTIVFIDNPMRLMAIIGDYTNCTKENIKNSLDTKSAPGGGDDSNGFFAGINLGNLGKITECQTKLINPDGLSYEEAYKYKRTKKTLSTLIDIFLNGNIDLLIDLFSIKEKGYCEKITDNYKEEAGLLLEQMGIVALLDGSIITSKSTIENSNKSDEDLKEEAEKETRYKKSIDRSISSSISLVRNDNYPYASFMDMSKIGYAAFMNEMKIKSDKLINNFKNLSTNEKNLMKWIKHYIFDIKLTGQNKSYLGYWYTLYLLNKPISFFQKEYDKLKYGYEEKPLYERGILGKAYSNYTIENKEVLTKNFQYSNIIKPLDSYKNIKRFVNSLNKYFITKYNYIKNKKYDKYNLQLPRIYGRIENKSLNTFLEIDKIRDNIREEKEKQMFLMQMIIKELNDRIDIPKEKIINDLENKSIKG